MKGFLFPCVALSAVFVCGLAGAQEEEKAPSPWTHRVVVVNGGATSLTTPHEIADTDAAQIGYHAATETAPALWFAFEGSYQKPLTVRMGVPKIESYRLLRPCMALVAPGLPQPEPPLPFPVPPGYGAIVYDTADQAVSDGRDGFTGTRSWMFAADTLSPVSAGRAFLVGYLPEGGAGKFWMTVGDETRFRFADLFGVVSKTVEIRRFHEMSDGFGATVWQVVTVLGLALVITLVAVSPK
ncbi:MAG TPA: hypothetical protein P5069_04060 [Candidatus Hydrogenedentes bacterium]|nr:hypothetical protein [Candidatus Hydrogenedentota bacterium]HOH51963.1 hypothetical protein [Candidatus Hydrogenedentota bacterium]HPA41100.1 hypothetical protein [Candidatus Hydrogenedentota bacterium]HRZ81608.1 hypothetical protein [Candidatus Hydrogenedentota bacterium]